ncbi:MAG: 2TM domain-containing protein [Candidatus Cloacimonetes bacterium]|nr:2TM domain-containing protein [Candidatus Cloacimonadota bacterium]
MENQDAYEKAKKRVEEKLGFYLHLAAYIAVNLFLIYLSLSNSPSYFWAKWTLIGWGFGIFFHGLGVFFFSEDSTIQNRMIEKELEKNTQREQDNH